MSCLPLLRHWKLCQSLVVVLTLLSTTRAQGEESRCAPEAQGALDQANKAPRQERASALDKALATLDPLVGDDAPADCNRIMGTALLWRSRAGALPEAAQRGFLRFAISQLEMAVQKYPGDVRAWELKAEAEEELGLYSQAAGTYNALAWVHPTHPFARGARVRLLVKAGRLEEALAAERARVAAEPNDWEAHLRLGMRLEALGHVEEAITEYERATALDEGIDTAPLALGALLARHGRWKEADAAFAKVDAVEYLLGWYSQGVCRVKQGDLQGARAWGVKLKKEEGGGALARRLQALIKVPGTQPLLGLPAYAEP